MLYEQGRVAQPATVIRARHGLHHLHRTCGVLLKEGCQALRVEQLVLELLGPRLGRVMCQAAENMLLLAA